MNWPQIIVVALIGAPSFAAAERFRVTFEGEVTSIDDGAPDSFFMGERVSGFVDFARPPEWSAQTVTTYTLVDSTGDPFKARYSYYSGFPDDISYIIEEAVGTGALGIATESGFLAIDSGSEVVSVQLGSSAIDSYVESGSSSLLALGNRGRYAELYSLGESIPRTLHTYYGPPAAGLQIYLSNFAFPPFDPDAADPEHAVLMILEAASFPGFTRGSIEFEVATGYVTSPISVDFDIVSYSIVLIPEPACVGLLATAWPMLGRRRSRRLRALRGSLLNHASAL